MTWLIRAALAALPIGALSGLVLGAATVSAMQVRRAALPSAPPEVRTSEMAQGMMWAAVHRPEDADACPQTSLLFQSGCVARTIN